MAALRSLLKQVLGVYVDYAMHFAGVSFPNKYGLRWKIDFLLSRYESETTHLMRSIVRPGMVCIDIGAHIGYFARIMARRAGRHGRVIAFEPDQENFPLLEKNTRAFPNVKRERDALSDTEGRVPFYHAKGSTGCHSLIPVEGESSGALVFATTLDSYLARNGITRVDIIKMDIEGGEWKALHGMEHTLTLPDVQLVIEYNPDALSRAGVNPHDMLRRLFASDFAIFAITKKGLMTLEPSDLGKIDQYLEAGSVNVYCSHVH